MVAGLLFRLRDEFESSAKPLAGANHEKSATSKGLGDDRMECLGRGIAVLGGHGFGPGTRAVRALPGSVADLLAAASGGDSLVCFRGPIWGMAFSRCAGRDCVGICGWAILSELSEQILAFDFNGRWAAFLFACGCDARSHCYMSRLQNKAVEARDVGDQSHAFVVCVVSC